LMNGIGGEKNGTKKNKYREEEKGLPFHTKEKKNEPETFWGNLPIFEEKKAIKMP